MIGKKARRSVKKIVKPLSEIVVDEHFKKIKKIKKNAREHATEFQKEARKTTATAIAAAFSFIIALFWRDAIQDLIDNALKNMGLTNQTYVAKIFAALFVTAIGVIAIMRISKWGQLENKDQTI